MEKPVVRELIQDDFNVQNLKDALHTLLADETAIAECRQDYKALKKKLGEAGASERAANAIMETVQNTS